MERVSAWSVLDMKSLVRPNRIRRLIFSAGFSGVAQYRKFQIEPEKAEVSHNPNPAR